MKRLTTKIKEEERTKIDDYFDTYYFVGEGRDGLPKAVNKLGKLEDLEEQIGMPLNIFIDIVKCNIVVYSIENGYLQELQVELLNHINNLLPCGFVVFAFEDNHDSEAWEDLYFNDFNKTWFLTREEAEKKLEELLNNERL